MEGIKVVSLNAKGLNTPEKRRILLQDLRRQRAQVAFIEETHFRECGAPTLRDHYFPHSYHSYNPDAKSKGVSILVSRAVPWTLLSSKCDNEGRYLFLKGKMGVVVVTLAVVYAPNLQQHTFLSRTLQDLSLFQEGILIFGGDLNCPLDPLLDTSQGTSSVSRAVQVSISSLFHRAQLVDVWRLCHPADRDYTFFSFPHQQYSRIDYLFVRHCDLAMVLGAEIGQMTWSDHAPISLRLKVHSTLSQKQWHWRLNESLLQDSLILADLQKELRDYFDNNLTREADPLLVWEAHKPFIRGVLIRHGVRAKRAREGKIRELLEDIHVLEVRHKASGDCAVLDSVISLRRQLTSLLSYKAKAAMTRCQHRFYEHGNKSGRMLARALKDQQLLSFVPYVQDPSGRKIHCPADIADEFGAYYSTLYNLECRQQRPRPQLRDSKIVEYIRSSGMPQLDQESCRNLDRPITLEEMEAAIKSSKSGKAPGPDGLTAQYYKLLASSLVPHLCQALNSLPQGSCFSRDSLFAHISIIPKEGKDPAACSSYRPISLLNMDLKLFTKILANRLSPLVSPLVDTDQAGFLPGREARDNVIKALNLLHLAESSPTPQVFLSTDAEKAFDRVNWNFIWGTLQHIGIREGFMTWLRAIYSSPSASVKVNGVFSRPFSISNGTRQGCPLSPLLFVLSLEPFLCTVRQHPDIQGISSGGRSYKITAYADDMLFTLSNPHISLPLLLREFDTFGSVANLKINFQKSEALLIGRASSQLVCLQQNFKFKWSQNSFKYLGTVLPSRVLDTFALNFPPMLRKLRVLLRSWEGKGFSWLGRVNILKMTILPKLLYLLAALPVHIPNAFLRSVNSLFLDFVWAHGRRRIRRHTLCAPKAKGGLSMPDLHNYHTACHLARLVDWCRHNQRKRWVELEDSFSSFSLRRLPWCLSSCTPAILTHPTIGPTLKVCARAFSKYDLSPGPSPLFPVLGNPAFSLGTKKGPFRRLLDADLHQASHFVRQGRWVTQDTLQSPEDIFHLDPWRSLQLRHFLTALPSRDPVQRPLTPLEVLCDGQGPIDHALSLTHSLLLSSRYDLRPSYVDLWERDLHQRFSDTQLQYLFLFTFRSSISTRTQESNYKLLTRWYHTPALLHRLFPQTSDTCWRCGTSIGSLLHIFWDCPRLRPFWRAVRDICQKFTDFPLADDPAFFLLHVSSVPISTYKKSVLRHLVDAAKSCIPLKWKSADPPTVGMWLQRVEDTRKMEDITLSARSQHALYFKTWYYWLEFIESLEGRTLIRVS